MQALIIIFSLLIVGVIVLSAFKKKRSLPIPDIAIERKILSSYVSYYQQLSDAEKNEFEQRVSSFLEKVTITGVETIVEDTDKVFVASAAIIPIFAFKNWEYRNIHEVLIYPGSFDESYELEGRDRNVLGMVGTGPMQNVMILSQYHLRNGFLNHTDKSNTAIHEFVHLVDKSDGDTDGYPGALLPHIYAIPWLKRIHQEIRLIQSGRSDINSYGATNEAEFLAVASEYFFEQPHLMQQKHPALYDLLQEIFLPGTNKQK
ncbi:zinc-dependent peptidase [Daejeonella sp.]|uniref:M90 family metallopeptidase n=1 Tax=Daejeonella sp. TaxID=2805397 RepID=UPI00272F4FE6|nr:M90 family metallopeptidase [Daejeonella sp.]MDP2414275.1 zinc-dependent peptidase [Daejeonella sp.]